MFLGSEHPLHSRKQCIRRNEEWGLKAPMNKSGLDVGLAKEAIEFLCTSEEAINLILEACTVFLPERSQYAKDLQYADTGLQ